MRKLSKIAFLVFAVLLAACNSVSSQTPPVASRLNTTGSPVTGVTEKEPTLTYSSQSTATPSEVPKSRILHTPTFTPFPTVPPNLAYSQFMDYLDNHSACKFPCIWGITPGVTSLEYLHSQLLPFGAVESRVYLNEWFGSTRYHISIPNPEGLSAEENIGAVFISDGIIVTEILVPATDVFPAQNLGWAEILSSYGKPDEILLDLVITPYPDAYYSLVLIYYEYGTYFFIDGDIPGLGEDGGRICPLTSKPIGEWNVVFKSLPTGDIPLLSDLTTGYYGDESSYRLFEKYQTKMTDELFYETYIVKQEDVCFDVFLPGSD